MFSFICVNFKKRPKVKGDYVELGMGPGNGGERGEEQRVENGR
jgi:hypothetical protein